MGVNCYGGGVFLSRYVGGLFSRLICTYNTRQEMSAELWRIGVTMTAIEHGNLGNRDSRGTQGKAEKSLYTSSRRVGGVEV
jgi:hypothetical protein